MLSNGTSGQQGLTTAGHQRLSYCKTTACVITTTEQQQKRESLSSTTAATATRVNLFVFLFVCFSCQAF
jgi:hypothetical protein